MGKLRYIPYVISIILGIIIPIVYVNAQESLPVREDRLFEKNGISVNLDSITYTDGKILSYDLLNPPTSKVIIHDWDKLSALSKSSITTTLVGQGYTDKGSFNPDPLPNSVVVTSK
ncbi:MAG TPA: hypothetical protein VIH70_06290 [Actinomycetota bacterium]|jgi:hypothetical protein